MAMLITPALTPGTLLHAPHVRYVRYVPSRTIVRPSVLHRVPWQRKHQRTLTSVQALQLDNGELLVGDVVSLVSFALWKQIAAIIFLPTFPGWLAPLTFNPLRFVEFGAFAATLVGTWVACATLVGAYKLEASSGAHDCDHRTPTPRPDLPTALRYAIVVWLVSQPVAAAELVLLTAAEGRTLVGVDGFASVLPLAASGPGEPFVTTAGVLGLMAVWRCWYTAYLVRA